MIYQRPDGTIINISVEVYLLLNDEEFVLYSGLCYGESGYGKSLILDEEESDEDEWIDYKDPDEEEIRVEIPQEEDLSEYDLKDLIN